MADTTKSAGKWRDLLGLREFRGLVVEDWGVQWFRVVEFRGFGLSKGFRAYASHPCKSQKPYFNTQMKPL